MHKDRCTISRIRLFLLGCRATTSFGLLFLVLITSSSAQELVRTSAALLPIASFRRSPEAFFYLGPFQEVLTGSAGVQYTDNVNLTDTDKISDLSFTLGLGLETTWVISHLNQLQFTFGGELMENFYSNGRSQVTFAVDPTSKIELKFEIGDLLVRLYDDFSYAQNPTTDPTATNTTNLNSFTNTIGAAVDADLNIAVLTLFADYSYNSQSGTNVQGQANPTTTGTRETFRLGPSLTFRLSPTILYGLNATATRSTSTDAANVNSLNVGPFINGKLTKEFEFDLSGGLSLIDTKPSIAPTYYFSLVIRYQINRHSQLVFSGSHDLVFTTGTNLTEENLFKVGTQLDLTRWITFTVSPFINFGDVKTTNLGVINSVSPGSYTQFGIEAGLDWKLRKRWSTSLSYNFVRRESGSTIGTGTTASNNYIQNTLALSLSYAF
jgi:opacity protein-like surface antigen